MSKERELLERCLRRFYKSGYECSQLVEDIENYLASANPSEVEPVDISDKSGPTTAARLPNGVAVSNVYEAYEAGLKEGVPSEAEPVAYWDTLNNILVPAVPLVSKRTCFKIEAVPLYLHPAPRKEFVRLSDEEITEIIGPYSMGTVGGYTRKLFDTIQDVLEEKNK